MSLEAILEREPEHRTALEQLGEEFLNMTDPVLLNLESKLFTQIGDILQDKL